MSRWALRGLVAATIALPLSFACSAKDEQGPPSAPCNDQTKGSAPICGKTCANQCGCAECQSGSQLFIDGALYLCSNGCFASSSGTGGTGSGGSSSGGAAGAGGGDPCKAVNCATDPPVCGACTTCACCSCNNGQSADIGGTAHVCQSGCYAPLSGDGG
jgi:hypothetical protein